MKAAPFEYSRPADVDEACALLAADDGARLIAGGQTLVPLMAMRLARPTRLIDIARIAGLAYVRDRRRCIAIGATTKQHVVESDPLVREQAAAARPGHAVRRPRRDAGARHRRRLARQWRSGGRDRAGGGDARRDAGLARRRQDRRDGGGRLLPRADGDGLADHRPALRRCGFRSGRSGGSARAFTRSTRGRAISPSSRPRRRSRSMLTAAARAPPSASARRRRCRSGSMRLSRRSLGSAFDEGQGASGGRRPRSPMSRRWPTCTPPPTIAAASRRRWRCAPSPMPFEMPRRGAHEGRARRQRRDGMRSRSSRARACSTACATSSCSPARMPAASTASAAPARCWSTASRCAPA